MKNKIFITGGAGYVGAVLVPKLLKLGHAVTVFDLFIYGKEVLTDHPNLRLFQGDIRNTEMYRQLVVDHDIVIHLACISNDPSFEMNPTLGKSINLDAFRPLVEASVEAGVERFIYASSSSVYGVKKDKNVHEDMPLEPLTDYSKFKAECESILSEYNSKSFTTVTIRPATVCGFSPRQRLDVVVNILTNLAFRQRRITVFGGDQLRPNIHIDDMTAAYLALVDAPKERISNQIFNAGYDNHSVLEIAQMVRNVVGHDVELIQTPTDDHRSYHVSSQKIFDVLGFQAKKSITNASEDLLAAFEDGRLPNSLEDEKYFNIRRMKSMNLN